MQYAQFICERAYSLQQRMAGRATGPIRIREFSRWHLQTRQRQARCIRRFPSSQSFDFDNSEASGAAKIAALATAGDPSNLSTGTFRVKYRIAQ
jgi:hypothetical protein